jgi:hypothetical protein
MCSGKFMQIHPFKSNLRSFKFSCRGRFRANSLVKAKGPHGIVVFSVFFLQGLLFFNILQHPSGFEEVDKHVKDVMVRWIGRVVQQAFQALVLAPLPVANGQVDQKSRPPVERGPESTLSWKRVRMCCKDSEAAEAIDPASELIIPCEQQD